MNNEMTQRLADERVDNLAALIMVSEEQLKDRERAEAGLAAGGSRVDELIDLVFGSDEPSVENYLATRGSDLVAA